MKKIFIMGTKTYGFFCFLLMCSNLLGQTLPENRVVTVDSLSMYLKKEVQQEINPHGTISTARLAAYFREKFSERYYFDWKNTADKFREYQVLYPEKKQYHFERAEDHRSKFSATTPWKLPFNYLNGKPVNSYALRHLARQHKMVDIAFAYFYDTDNNSITYFTEQVQSLNTSLKKGAYEKIEDGNGVYEAFRSGYRVLNWLEIHNLFLGEKEYDDEDQLNTIATLLQHGAHLYDTNQEFVSGNHQTRGMSGLAMIAILLRDFKGTDVWYAHAMKLLEEHITKEINADGFQFERSVHYHMSDIENYYFVYQLAKISKLNISKFWQEKIRALFTTLVKIGYPDKSAPVLQDDTDIPWAEKNDISGALTLGYLLFEDPEMGYFANAQVEAKMFWFLNEQQLALLENLKQQQPKVNSTAFKNTGYYIMRDGWKPNGKMLIISAGLDAEKPDHQHGDILGIQAMANQRVILPNYQVRYSLADLEFFKNSLVKNVALVDTILQGRQYTSNKGGSGFGKFKQLPQPTVKAWYQSDSLDFFAASHNGFEDVGVTYSRQVIFIQDGFWIVKDNFNSSKEHTYKQVWQGHYSLENGAYLLRATFDNGTGNDIYQLRSVDSVITSGKRGKQWSVVAKNNSKKYNFITILFPFDNFENRIDETVENPSLLGWEVNTSPWKLYGENAVSLTKNSTTIFFLVDKIEAKDITIEFKENTDIQIKRTEKEIVLQSLHVSKVQLRLTSKGKVTNVELLPGKSVAIPYK